MALFICFFMGTSICFAKEALVSSDTYNEFTDCGSQHVALVAEFQREVGKKNRNYASKPFNIYDSILS